MHELVSAVCIQSPRRQCYSLLYVISHSPLHTDPLRFWSWEPNDKNSVDWCNLDHCLWHQGMRLRTCGVRVLRKTMPASRCWANLVSCLPVMQVVHFVCMQCMLCVQTECCLYALHVSESAKDLLGLPVLTAFWAYPAIRCKLDNHSAISRHYLKKFLDNALFCLHVYFSFLMNFKQFLFYQKIKHLLLPICTCCSADAYITSELFFWFFWASAFDSIDAADFT